MCEQDVTIGKENRPYALKVPVTTSLTPAFIQDDTRMTVIFTSASVGTVTYTMDPAGSAGSGINIPAGDRPVILNLKDHGAIVTEAWYAILSAGSQTLEIYGASRNRNAI